MQSQALETRRLSPGTHWFFFIHIFERQYDKKCQKVYHITFYHILKFSKSLSYPLYHIFKYIKNLLFYLIFQKLHHISFYHIIKNFIIFSLSYFNMIKRCKKCTLSYFFNMIKKCEIWIKKKQMYLRRMSRNRKIMRILKICEKRFLKIALNQGGYLGRIRRYHTNPPLFIAKWF